LRDLDRRLQPSKNAQMSGKVVKFDGLTALRWVSSPCGVDL